MYLEIFLGNFAVFRGISQKYLNFVGPRPREIAEALSLVLLMADYLFFLTTHVPEISVVFVWVCGLSVKRSNQGCTYLIC